MPFKVPKFSIKLSICVLLFALLIAFYFRLDSSIFKNELPAENIRKVRVLDGLLYLENDNAVGDGLAKPRVAVGYGACLDLFVNATDLLKSYSLSGPPQHFDELKSDEQFLKSFAYYFKHGAAAERYMPSSKLFKKWASQAEQIPTARWALGGNAPVMATRFLKEGCGVLLAAKMTASLRSLIPEEIQVASKTLINKDDVHLIMEYKTDETWNDLKSPRANRYIFHNDINNPTISSLEDFGDALPKFNPHVFVVSGLQMMDNYPFEEGVQEERLQAVKRQMITQGRHSRVHFEMASFVEEELLRDLMRLVIPFSDSLGMNEQELSNLYNLYLFGDVAHVADFNPRVATVLDQMRKLFKLIRNGSKSVESSKSLSRIHVHTLAFQAILVERGSKWRRAKAAAAKASLTASRHVCGSARVDVAKARLIMDSSFALSVDPSSKRMNVSDERPVSCWDEQISLGGGEDVDVYICVAPVLVCTAVKQTAGCGDNISAAGLVLQI